MTIHIIEKDERESKFAQLRALGAELSVPVPEVFVSRKIENPGCEPIIKDSRSHTWTRNMYNFLFIQWAGLYSYTNPDAYGAGYLTLLNTSGTRQRSPISATMTFLTNTAINSNYGIVCGTSDAVYSFENVDMTTRIAHGTGTGQLSYTAMTQIDPVYTSGTKEWAGVMKRVFNNNSAASIGVKEVGMLFWDNTNSRAYGCCRDVLGSTDTINVGGQYTVTYTVKLTFPA